LSRPHHPPHRPSREARYPSTHRPVRLAAAAAAQRGATKGAWMTFGVMVVSLAVAIVGALGGVPSIRRRGGGPLVEARG
jgi:hypothetical protein